MQCVKVAETALHQSAVSADGVVGGGEKVRVETRPQTETNSCTDDTEGAVISWGELNHHMISCVCFFCHTSARVCNCHALLRNVHTQLIRDKETLLVSVRRINGCLVLKKVSGCRMVTV